jgi:hypothetical protein
MRIRRVAFILSALLITPLISISPARAADELPTPPKQIATDLKEEYKIALAEFRQEFRIYEDKRREINRLFKSAIEKALTDTRLANPAGQTQIQKRREMKAKQNAVIAATMARDAAIEALGAPPIAPTPPAKLPKNEKSKGPKEEKTPVSKN